MPSAVYTYQVLLDFNNDTRDCVSLQVNYGRSYSQAVLVLKPGESISLVLDSGTVYKYAVKTRSIVADVVYVSVLHVL